MKLNPVLQNWVMEECSWKEQTVMLSAFRGCDGEQKGDVSKNLLHNFRAAIMNDADPSSTFMQWRDIKLELFCENLDHYPMHFLVHLTHGIEVLGYRHPDLEIRDKWHQIYLAIVNALHFQPESKQVMIERLKDNNV